MLQISKYLSKDMRLWRCNKVFQDAAPIKQILLSKRTGV